MKNQTNLNLQFASLFRGLKRGLFDQIRCSQWPQGMVLDGLKGFQSEKSKSMTFNYKIALRYLVLPQMKEFSREKVLKGKKSQYNPPTHPGGQLVQVDSEIKNMG